MSLKFSDGMEFDLNAKEHIERRSDGLYVVGGGSLIPIDSVEEGLRIIAENKKSKEEHRDLIDGEEWQKQVDAELANDDPEEVASYEAWDEEHR